MSIHLYSSTHRVLIALATLMSLISPTSAQEDDVFFLGHSLVNFDMPSIFSKISASKNKSLEYEQQVMNGASLNSNFVNYASAQGTPYTTALSSGKYENFVVTEAVPLLNHLQWSDTYVTAVNFLDYAREHQPNIRFYIYETWHCINTGRSDTTIVGLPSGQECWYDNADSLLWQARLLDDFKLWRGIVDTVRSRTSYSSVFMIPVGQAMHKLSLLIESDQLPGLQSFRDLFRDDIHLNLLGNYYVACVMFAALFGESPEGSDTSLEDNYGNFWFTVNAEVAAKMQKAAWETVCEQPYSGVSCSASTRNEFRAKPWSPHLRKAPSNSYDLLGRQGPVQSH